MLEALDRFKEHPHGHQNEGDGIDLCRQDAHTVIAKGFASIGRSLGLSCRKPSQAECKKVREGMSCIGEQGQRMGEYPSNHLSGHNEDGQKEGQAQGLLATPCV
jgi:hypothetical protein